MRAPAWQNALMGAAVGLYADALRMALGSRGVLENNSLRAGYGTGGKDAYSAMYREIVRRDKPITYQTSVASRLGDSIDTVVRLAASLGACAVELPSGTTPDPRWKALLEANAP